MFIKRKIFSKRVITDCNINSTSNLIIQAIYSDEGFLGDRINDFLQSSTKNAYGSFEITFEDSNFKNRRLENETETYLIVRNEKGQILYRTKTNRY